MSRNKFNTDFDYANYNGPTYEWPEPTLELARRVLKRCSYKNVAFFKDLYHYDYDDVVSWVSLWLVKLINKYKKTEFKLVSPTHAICFLTKKIRLCILSYIRIGINRRGLANMKSVDSDFYKVVRKNDDAFKRVESQDFVKQTLNEIKRVAKYDSHYRMWYDVKIGGGTSYEIAKKEGYSPEYINTAVYRLNKKLRQNPRILKHAELLLGK